MTHTGFIGLGAMGAPMAAHLAQAGQLRMVYNRSPARAEAFAATHGVVAAERIEAVARACEVIVICVSNSKAVEAVVDGIEPGLRPGAIVVDSTTADPAMTRRTGARLAEIPVGDTLIKRVASPALRARAYGLVYLLTFGTAAATVPLVAWLYESDGDLGRLLWLLAGAAALLSAAAWSLPRGRTDPEGLRAAA